MILMVVLFLVEKAKILNNLLIHKRKFMYYDLGKLL